MKFFHKTTNTLILLHKADLDVYSKKCLKKEEEEEEKKMYMNKTSLTEYYNDVNNKCSYLVWR